VFIIRRLIVFFAVTTFCAADIVYVDVNAPNSPGTGSYTDPFRKIQDAIDAADSNDTIEIRPGLYSGPGNYNLDPNGKSITIRSGEPNNPNIVERTIIDPNLAGRGFNIHSGENLGCIISGLTIKNAHTTDLGAGVYCFQSSPIITNCIFTDNRAEIYGGGAIGCEQSNSLIKNCIISRNYAYDGGGLECWFASPVLINCTISNNLAVRYGGGIDCYYSNPSLSNCNLVNNKTDGGGAGGAVSLWSSDVDIKNSILWANESETGTQLYLHIQSSVSVNYCDVQAGISGIAQDSQSTVNWGSGNIDTDPCFASFDPNGDPNLWDFHLQSTDGRWNSTFHRIDLNNDGIINLLDFAGLAGVWMHGGNQPEDLDNSGVVDSVDLGLFSQYFLANSERNGWISDASMSPCIDAGDPNYDWTSEPWPNGKRINMGAYGGTNQASKNGNLADFDVSGKVDFADFAALAGKWATHGGFIEDLNSDGMIDYADVGIFAKNWLWRKEWVLVLIKTAPKRKADAQNLGLSFCRRSCTA
jgi:hypothetical protein